jgi:hypothetical protein
MPFTQIYTNTTTENFATRNGDPNGTATVASLVGAVPGDHLPVQARPTTTPSAFPNSLFIGCGLNYMRIKMFTDAPASFANIPVFHVYGWSQESRTGLWSARRICALTPSAAGANTTNTANIPIVGTYREVFDYGTSVTAGDAKLYTGSANGGGFFLIDTIGTEFLEIHVTQPSAANNYAALCGSL